MVQAMMRLRNVSLEGYAREELRQIQQSINALNAYSARVAAAKSQFASKNRSSNPTFRAVRSALTRMCNGTRRCGYCEDSVADEVEHIKPKDLYPEAAFVWKNFVYACGPCNGAKSSRFSVISRKTGRVVEVGRRPKQSITAPEPGEPLLIDPRRETPLDFMQLDLLDTFLFLPVAPAGSTAFERAQYTIETLKLNDRDYLLAARREAYLSYRARLREYITEKTSGVSRRKLNNLVKALKNMGHPTVWQEMKNQHPLIAELNILFTSAPEAVLW